MEINLAYESVKFMVIGMGTVFVFLIIMIILMNLQGFLVQKFFPDKIVEKTSTNNSSTSGSKKNKVAAIMAATVHHNQFKA